MVVNDFDVERIACIKTKTYSPLIVDAYAPLTFPVVLQGLQTVGWRQPQVLNTVSRVDLHQPHQRTGLHISRKLARIVPIEYFFRFVARKRFNHCDECKHFVFIRQAPKTMGSKLRNYGVRLLFF